MGQLFDANILKGGSIEHAIQHPGRFSSATMFDSGDKRC